MIVFAATDNSKSSFELLRELIHSTGAKNAIPTIYSALRALLYTTDLLVLVDINNTLIDRVNTPEFANEFAGVKNVIYFAHRETENSELVDNGKIICRELLTLDSQSIVTALNEINETKNGINLV